MRKATVSKILLFLRKWIMISTTTRTIQKHDTAIRYVKYLQVDHDFLGLSTLDHLKFIAAFLNFLTAQYKMLLIIHWAFSCIWFAYKYVGVTMFPMKNFLKKHDGAYETFHYTQAGIFKPQHKTQVHSQNYWLIIKSSRSKVYYVQRVQRVCGLSH